MIVGTLSAIDRNTVRLQSESVSAIVGIRNNSISRYIIKIARLGGYLARANDPAPGNIVMWRGLSRLTDIELGALAGAKIVGN